MKTLPMRFKFACPDLRYGRWSFFFVVLLFFVALPLVSQAQNGSDTPAAVTKKNADKEARRAEEARASLTAILQSIEEKRKRLETLQRQLAVAKQESEKQELQQQINELEKAIKASQQSFESIATGGVDLDVFKEKPQKEFDWRGDLLEILKPIFEGLKDLTEKPRTIEKLRGEISYYQDRLTVINEALANIAKLKQESAKGPIARRLEETEALWLQRKTDTQRDLDVAQYQLDNILQKETSFFANAEESFSAFFKGRGLTLFLAIFAAVVVWFLLQTLLRLFLRRRDVEAIRIRKPYFRLLIYGYRLITVLLSLLALLLVLYVSSDWVLLGLALILLVAAAISSKNYLPRFMTETKLLLNLGAVREGERVIYNGLPWRIRSINVYSILYNPELHGGVIRLPLSEMANLSSRPYHRDEPWFPSRAGDFVLLADGSYGQILQQTPEVVQLKVLGATRTYATSDYLGQSPRNLSLGSYAIAVTFGIDYQHQAICLEEVPAIFHEALHRIISQSTVGESLDDILVEFKEAAASSLDYLIYVTMSSASAGSYYKVGRLIQQACVEVCNQHHWIIPFGQLTVHPGDGFEGLGITRD